MGLSNEPHLSLGYRYFWRHSHNMTIRQRRWRLSLVLAFVGCLLTSDWHTRAQVELPSRVPGTPPIPADQPFAPSNARTADGGYIATESFFPSSRCAVCHQDTHRA